MGDRSNIVLILETTEAKRWQRATVPGKKGRALSTEGTVPGPALWLYSHWGGKDFRDAEAAAALRAAKSRWNDPAYGARIFITSIFADLDGATGGGVSFSPCDNEHDVRVIHFPTRSTWLVADTDLSKVRDGSVETFESFTKGAEAPPWETRW